VLAEYDVLLGTLTDYAAIVIQYGYMVLFVGAFPLSPTLALVSSYIQIRIDGWRLCQAHRRPQPKTAEDMGVWQEMIEIISFLGVVYNYGLIYFTSHYCATMSWEYRWILFIITEHFMFALKFVLSNTIDDIPEEVQMQLDR
jgi:Calcium-activated chloride channel